MSGPIDWDAPPPKGYRLNPRGDLVRQENIPPLVLDMDRVVRGIHAYGEDLSAQMARYRAYTMLDVADYGARVVEEYGGRELGGDKGNVSLTSYDGRLKVSIAQGEYISVGPQILAAQALVEELIDEWAPGANKHLRALVNQAFRRDAAGNVSVYRLIRLRGIHIDDDRWREVQRAISDAMQPAGKAEYVRLHRRDDPRGRWVQVPLSLATVRDPPPASPARRLETRFRSAIAEAEREGLKRSDIDAVYAAAKRPPAPEGAE